MTINFECPFCHIKFRTPIKAGKNSYMCMVCETVFPKAVLDNIYAYSLNKDVTKGIEWDV